MKFDSFLCFALTIPAATEAFTSSTRKVASFRSPLTFLQSTTRPDASSAIKEALEASKKFGPTSPEARIAWEAVEDMDSSDTSEASKGNLVAECLLESEDDVSNACIEYGEKLESLYGILQEYEPSMVNLKTLATDLRDIKLAVTSSAPAAKSPELTAALEAAKAAEKEFGKGSKEAIVAWSELEEVASAGVSNAIGKTLSAEECEIADNAQAACEALEALSNALKKAKST